MIASLAVVPTNSNTSIKRIKFAIPTNARDSNNELTKFVLLRNLTELINNSGLVEGTRASDKKYNSAKEALNKIIADYGLKVQ